MASSCSEVPGQLPQDVYDTVLPRWRSAIRNVILKAVECESPVLARMQNRFRNPWLDVYFLYTSSLGTHTFFMIALPVLFFFGYHDLGRGLIFVLASGIYLSSFIKDLVCAPRPFSPPLTRLTIGTHHLEYGFPSTHSTNSVSLALFVFGHVHRAYTENSAMSDLAYCGSCVTLVIYVISIVFGRLYLGMHSATDCIVGVALGAGVWGAYVMVCDTMERLLSSSSWTVPCTIVPVCLLLVHFHPQPVDDCPCFEDAIAIISVILGAFVARWHSVYAGVDDRLLQTVMPGGHGADWTFGEKLRWCLIACLKVNVGIIIIFIWRLLAKSVLHLVLPPLFRALALCFDLPNRRFYTPATDYAHVPTENGLHPIPSVIDLPSAWEVSGVYAEDTRSGSVKRRGRGTTTKQDLGKGMVDVTEHPDCQGKELENGKGTTHPGAEVKHYDADVLTKVVVYAGIAIFAVEGVPVLFSLMGWGIKPW
ncbi:phosphatidic acid phosphatase type 2/haloperoxidase [Pisolithus sp. B1]|nr:phosphatidic acid phosphatase type 2/haloperoxidase [Pisolithus sp. B1]